MNRHRGRAARLPIYWSCWLFVTVYLLTIIVGQLIRMTP
jgi:hypothetical protein